MYLLYALLSMKSDQMMWNSAICQYPFVREQVLIVSAGEEQEWQFQCFSTHKCNEHHCVPSFFIKHCSVIILASSRIGRETLERDRETIAKWPGRWDQLRKLVSKGSWALPNVNVCNITESGEKLGKNNVSFTTTVLTINPDFPPHFGQVRSQLSHLSY